MENDSMGTQVIQIVEDDQSLADYFTEILSEKYDVRTSHNGFQALVQYDSSVDVILLDRNLPDLQGEEVLNRIRDYGFPCRVVMVTGVDPSIDIIEMGITDYLIKPVTKNKLLETVDNILSLSSYDRELAELYTLSNKLAALRKANSTQELEANDSYWDLLDQINQQRKRIDEIYFEMDDNSFDVLLRA